jgi:hypothetical protein
MKVCWLLMVSTTDLSLLVSITAVSISALSAFLAQWRWQHSQANAVITQLQKDVAELKASSAKNDVKMDLLWSYVQKELPKIFHSPHTPKLDQIIEDYVAGRGGISVIMAFKKAMTEIYQENRGTDKGEMARFALMGADAKLVDLGRKDLVGKNSLD